MGRIRRGGYIITWFIGDHEPRHVHVETSNGKLIGRLDLRTGVEWKVGSPIRSCYKSSNSWKKNSAYEIAHPS